jgi:hypothetical protein
LSLHVTGRSFTGDAAGDSTTGDDAGAVVGTRDETVGFMVLALDVGPAADGVSTKKDGEAAGEDSP